MKNPCLRTSATLLVAAGISVLGTVALQAAPVLIDDFSDTIAPNHVMASQTGSMLGGERDLNTFDNTDLAYQASGGAIKFTATGSVFFEIVYDGSDGDPHNNSFGLPGVDLTGGGTNDRITIDVTAVTGQIDEVNVYLENELMVGSAHTIAPVTAAGALEFPFSLFTDAPGGGVDLTSVKSISIAIEMSSGSSVSIGRIVAGQLDDQGPNLKVLKRKNLKKPRPRHNIRGKATDISGVDKVEVRAPGKKGWRKTKLRPSGKFKYRTAKLKKKKNVFKFRGYDIFGNRSKVLRVKASGRVPGSGAGQSTFGTGGGR